MANKFYAWPWASRLNSIALFIFTAITVAWGKGFVAPEGSLDPSWGEAPCISNGSRPRIWERNSIYFRAIPPTLH